MLVDGLVAEHKYQMGDLLRAAKTPLPLLPAVVPVGFPGKVTTLQWPRGGPPPELLGLHRVKTLAAQQSVHRPPSTVRA